MIFRTNFGKSFSRSEISLARYEWYSDRWEKFRQENSISGPY